MHPFYFVSGECLPFIILLLSHRPSGVSHWPGTCISSILLLTVSELSLFFHCCIITQKWKMVALKTRVHARVNVRNKGVQRATWSLYVFPFFLPSSRPPLIPALVLTVFLWVKLCWRRIKLRYIPLRWGKVSIVVEEKVPTISKKSPISSYI
jgi:hypothetical protein